ncbi:hypothetical protein OSB04_001137 [Centaurea solstitialis]|uniref:Uncharacterized protein n=1 Tax=Centaurea solstitialis TaxID=347529 RepID=A0AA38U334_9ASTR|nr:hypothetical protein OSB04_001137 [Centaurea solstitialis]
MAEVAEEQWRPEVEEVVAVGLKATTTVDMLPSNGNSTIVTGPIITANGDDTSSDDEVHPPENGGAPDNIDISGILDFDENTKGNTETVHEGVAHQLEAGESSRAKEQVVEEEIVELEFEKAKLGTHTMHCPNCNHQLPKSFCVEEW